MKNKYISRRNFIRQSTLATASLSLLPALSSYKFDPTVPLMKRSLGNLNHEVTTFGLGGQASIQWTPADVDPVAIIEKAFKMGVNYFDTSNLYGPSQMNYGKAFHNLGLVPGFQNYDKGLRKTIFLTSKTHLRLAKGVPSDPDLNHWSNGDPAAGTVGDVKRTLSQVFGDGKGNYPKGAYLDMVLMHAIKNQAQVDAVLLGYDNPDPQMEQIGALAALVDLRDGTNFTGLNPEEEKLIKHIGFSGHYNAGIMMQLIRSDHRDELEGLLVSINANDKQYFNMQNNVIPLAKAKNMGVIGMKTFADGAMYSKEARWSSKPEHVVRNVGSPEVPYQPLIQYSLTTPGIDTLIVGIGQISEDPEKCQLTKNIAAAQIKPDGLTKEQRKQIEEWAAHVKNGKTNYFQDEEGGLTAARNIRVEKEGDKTLKLKWDTAYAGDSLIEKYLVFNNDKMIGAVEHHPQTTQEPFVFDLLLHDGETVNLKLLTIDVAGKQMESNVVKV